MEEPQRRTSTTPRRGGRGRRRRLDADAGDIPVVHFEKRGRTLTASGRRCCADLTFSVGPRSFQFLTGPSGAGKTTLLRLIADVGDGDSAASSTIFGEGGEPHLDKDPRGESSTQAAPGAMASSSPGISACLDHLRLTTRKRGFAVARAGAARRRAYCAEVTELLAWVGLGNRMHVDAPRAVGRREDSAPPHRRRALITRPELAARRRAHRQRRSPGRRPPAAAAVHRAQPARHLRRHRDARPRADGISSTRAAWCSATATS